MVTINAVEVYCVASSTHSAWQILGGIEDHSGPRLNIDAKYTSMQVVLSGNTWEDMNPLYQWDTPFSVSQLATDAYNTYLPPLN